MDVDLLRKRLKEIRESIASGTMPEVPGMENAYQPTNSSPVEPYNPPEVAAPTVPATTPISTNTPAATTPISTPVTARPTTPVSTVSTVSTAKTTAPRTTPETANTPKIDPKSGKAGAKVFSDITTKNPALGEAGVGKNGLIDAYNSGFNGTDLTKETMENARAGNYMPELEAVYNAGKDDKSEKLANDKASKDLSTDAARHEKLMRELNIKQAQKLAHTTGELDDLSTEAARREHILQKKLDNHGKSIYTSGNTTGDGENENNTNSGNFQYPTADFSVVSNDFGELDDYSGDYHLGIDIKEADGVNSEIHAAFYGEIVYKGWAKEVVNNDDNGYIIIIRHHKNINGKEITFYSGYFHLDPTGTQNIGLTSNYVDSGTVIGMMGNTGHSTGPHLHFTIFTTTMEINKDFNPTGYTPKKINGYSCSSKSGNTIFYDPKKVFETNGAILG